ncbi:MAG: motility protein A [Planctomycetota bacterium]|jgi:chemotaxis protein MotA
MDLATIAGLAVGLVCLGLGIFSRGVSPDSLTAFAHLPSALIVVGGTLAALFLAVPMGSVLNAWRVVVKTIFYRRPSERALVEELVRYAEVARREGILALEPAAESARDPFLARALGLAVDGTDPKEIEDILAGELDALAERHAAGRRTFEVLAKYAPAWGLIGTLVGLILMLGSLRDDPAAIGPGMSLALVTTFYGAVLANFLFGPIAEKLQERSEEETSHKRIILLGIVAIQSGDNPRIVRQKLRSQLPPSIAGVAAW